MKRNKYGYDDAPKKTESAGTRVSYRGRKKKKKTVTPAGGLHITSAERVKSEPSADRELAGLQKQIKVDTSTGPDIKLPGTRSKLAATTKGQTVGTKTDASAIGTKRTAVAKKSDSKMTEAEKEEERKKKKARGEMFLKIAGQMGRAHAGNRGRG